MSCRDVLDVLDDFLEGSLTERQHATLQEHLRLCPPCRQYLDSYAATVHVSRSVRDGPLEPVPEKLVQAILALKGQIVVDRATSDTATDTV